MKHVLQTGISTAVVMLVLLAVGCQSGSGPVEKQKAFRADLQELADARAAGDDARVQEIVSKMRQIERIQPQLIRVWIPPGEMKQAPKQQRLAAVWLWKRLYGADAENARTGFDRGGYGHAVDAEKDPEIRDKMTGHVFR